MREFLEGFDVEVVALLRRHDSWWPSLWAQAIKTVVNPPWDRSFESFLKFQQKRKPQHFCFRTLIEAWEKNFPGQVHPIAYERSQAPDGVVPLFFEAIGRPELAAGLPHLPAESNVTPKIDVLSLIDYFKRASNIPEARRDDLIARALSFEGQGLSVSNFLSGRLRRQLTDMYADSDTYPNHRFAPEGMDFFRDPLAEDDGVKGRHVLPEVPAIELLVNQVFEKEPLVSR